MGGNQYASTRQYILQEVVSGVQQLTGEEKIRQQCQAREDYAYRERIREANRKRELQKRDTIINEQAKQLAYYQMLFAEHGISVEEN